MARRAIVLALAAGCTGLGVAAASDHPFYPEGIEQIEDEEPAAEPEPVEAEAVSLTAEADPVLDFHRPAYLVIGPDSPEAKFRISIKARLLRHSMGEGASSLRVFLGFTQTSFWELGLESSPFRDTDYNPELFASWRRNATPQSGWRLLILHGGLAHESNGRDGAASRSWNYAFVEPHLVFRRRGANQDLIRLSARVWPITQVSEDNPDLLDFYGYGELAGAIYLGRFSARLAARLGKNGDKGSALLDLAWQPFRRSTVQLLLQGWSGYGESLLDYNVRDSSVRLGVMIAR